MNDYELFKADDLVKVVDPCGVRLVRGRDLMVPPPEPARVVEGEPMTVSLLFGRYDYD